MILQYNESMMGGQILKMGKNEWQPREVSWINNDESFI